MRKGLFSFLAVLLVASISRPAEVRAQTEQPNIILILADDLGYGDIGAYGQKKIRTPRLDKMAQEGTRFTQFYAGSAVCAPSRWSLLTGEHMGHAYVRGNASISMRADETILPEVLKEAGYATGMFGKWGLGEPDDSGAPHRNGFDEFLGYLSHRHAHSYYTDHLFEIRNGRTERVPIDTTQYTHDLFAERALAFIDGHQEDPFFLYLPFTIPHAELLVPEDAMEPYLNKRGKSLLKVETPFPCCGPVGSYRAQPQPHAAFAGMVSRLDRDVGRILDRLAQLGLDDDTIVLFTSDNGPHLEGGGAPGFFESNGPLRGLKRDLYEGGIRVPMIAWGGGVPAGEVSDHAWAMWDVLPTLSAVAGVAAPKRDGLSMADLLRENGAAPKHEHLYWEFNNDWGGHHVQAVRKGDFKLLRFRAPGSSWVELYDLSRDVGEYDDLAGRRADVVARLEKVMDAARTEPEHPRFQIPYR